MKKIYILFFLFTISVSIDAQTWKPLGPDENYNPSITFSAYTNIVIAADGTPYIAYNDNSHDGKATVKKFDGSQWITVGQPGFTEGYASDVFLALSPDGTPYVAYVPYIPSQNYVTVHVRKLSGNTWVNVTNSVSTGIGPSLSFDTNGSPYLAFEAAYGYGLSVRKFVDGWALVGDTVNVAGSLINSSRLVTAADGTPYVAYSAVGNNHKVSVKKLVSGNWQLVGHNGFTSPGASNVTMALSTDGSIYVAYTDSTNGGKAMVQQYTNGNWSVISPSGLSKGGANYLSIAVSPDQTPYLTFSDGGDSSKAFVKKFSSGNWVTVGSGAISSAAATTTSIAIDANGTPYITYADYSLYDKVMVKKFISNKWTDVGEGGASEESSSSIVLKITKTGTPFVSFNDALFSGRASVKQYQSGSWQYVGQPGISQSNAGFLDMATAPDGTPYIMYKDTTIQNFAAIVKMFTGAGWVAVGNPVSTGYGVGVFSIAIAPNGIPFTAFEDPANGGKITVQNYSGGGWSNVGAPSFSLGDVGNINLAIDSNNTPYVAFSYLNNNKASVEKFVGGAWVTIGTEGFTPATKDLNLALAPDGTPYIAYYDAHKGAIAVEEFTNNNWVFVGGVTASDSSASVPKLVFDQKGGLFLCFLQGRSSNFTNHTIVRKLIQGKWTDIGNKNVMPWSGLDNAMAITPNGDLVYAYLSPQLFVRTNTPDSLAAPPVITSCTPNFGGTGTVATITGFNFSNASAVKFGLSTASSFTVISPTVISATVGAGASGLVSVTTSYGTGTYDSYVFSASPPVITSFSPHKGDVNSVVTIRGKNFGTLPTDNIVYFGAVTATIISANDSTIMVNVPSGSTYQPLSVTTRQLTAFTNSPFDVTFKGQTNITSGSFLPKQDYPTIQNPSSLVIADINNDGKPDIVVSDYGTTIFANSSTKNNIVLNGQNNTNNAGNTISAGDFDGDGKIDIAYNSNPAINISRNNSSANNYSFLSTETIQPVNYPIDIVVGDVDGDGRPDIVVGSQTDASVAVLRNSSSSGNYIFFEDEVYFRSLSLNAFPQSITLADLDGDGKPEIIVISPDYNFFDGTGDLTIFKNNSTAHLVSFTKVAQYITAKNPQKPVVADLDGDGKPDIVLANSGSNTVTIYKNQSTGTISFAPGLNFTTGKQPDGVCIADLDGDGNPDMAVVNGADNTVSVFKNTSLLNNIDFAPKVDFKTGSYPSNVIAADLDGDGAPELIVNNLMDNSISVFRNNIIDFTLPTTNFAVAITSATCKGSNNGSITITAAQPMSYTATVTGGNVNSSVPFTTSGTISNLAAGTYNLCITVAGQSNFQQCYSLVITEPKDLSLYSTINDTDNSIKLSLNGGSLYNINLNGVLYTTADSVITLTLADGNNTLMVTTDKLCQGRVEKSINTSGKITPYPDPFQNTLNINLGNKTIENVSVEIHGLSDGRIVYSSQYINQSGVILLDLKGLKNGVYALHLSMDNSEKVFKIIKQ